MKQTLFRKIFWSIFFVVAFLGTVTIAASTGIIDPGNVGNYKAAFLDSSVVSDTAINFGKFATEGQYNITVSNTELRGYAWGSSVGWMVMNCADTTSGCSSTNGNFKVANDGTGKLSGYAWGENTGWINFGPFSNTAISTVKINSGGFFDGTQGSAGYAWSQNYGWIVFDCSDSNTCVNTDWRQPTTQGGTSGGSPSTGGAGSVTYIQIRSIVCDSFAYTPHWGLVGAPYFDPTTAPAYVANSQGHCRFDSGVSFQWGDQTAPYTTQMYGASPLYTNTIGPTNANGALNTTMALAPTTAVYHIREILDPKYAPFSYPSDPTNRHPNSAEFYCQGDGKNYDNYDFLRFPYQGETYYCIAFNTFLDPADYYNPPVTNPGSGSTGGSGTGTNPGSGTNTGTGNNGGNGSGNTGGTTTPPGGPDSGGTTNPGTGPTEPPPAVEPPNNPAESTNEPGPFDGGVILPPALTEAIEGIIGSIGGIGHAVVDVVQSAGKTVIDIARTPTGKTVSTITTAIGIASTAMAAFATLLIANPFALSEIALLPFRLWTLLLVFFGYKKRTHPWGVVYDSVTKQPIDPAYVVLMDMQGNEVATSITDIDGRYGFSVPPGTYKIVANKTNFEFPSKKLAGKSGDELYNDLYFGEEVVIREQDEIVAKNIPLDQLNFDWNEFAKNQQKRLSYFHKSDLVIAHVSNFFFGLGFIIATISILASHTLYNSIVFLIYVVLYLIRKSSPRFKPKGSITEVLTDQPMPFAIVHIISPCTGQEITHKVADRIGNYYCLVPNSTYTVVIDRKNPDGSYTKIPVTEPVTVTKGYLNKAFRV